MVAGGNGEGGGVGKRDAERSAGPHPRHGELQEGIRGARAHRRAVAAARHGEKVSLTPQGQLKAGLINYDQYIEMLVDWNALERGEPLPPRGLVQSDITGRKNLPVEVELAGKVLVPAHVTISADVVEVRCPYHRPVKPGKRGEVRNMSAGSRRRLMRLMAKVRGLENAIFCTLTYPGEYSADWRVWKKNLRAIVRRLERLAQRIGADLAGIWRLEFQLRGAPHYHLVLLGLHDAGLLDRAKADRTFAGLVKRYCESYPQHRLSVESNWIHALRAFISQCWFEIVGSGDDRHLRAGVQADRVASRQHAMHYVSKYVAKVDDRLQEKATGRVWGKFGELDTSPSLELVLPEHGVVELRRMVARWLKSKGRRKYARWLKRAHLGFHVLGLGDSSSNDQLILRMIDAAYDYALERSRHYREERERVAEAKARGALKRVRAMGQITLPLAVPLARISSWAWRGLERAHLRLPLLMPSDRGCPCQWAASLKPIR